MAKIQEKAEKGVVILEQCNNETISVRTNGNDRIILDGTIREAWAASSNLNCLFLTAQLWQNVQLPNAVRSVIFVTKRLSTDH